MKIRQVERELKILDFDIENRPLSYLGMDFTTADITAIAASWVGEDKISVWLLGHQTIEEMLTGFTELYDEADMVTGHYIRKHDLLHINGASFEFGLGHLEDKLTSDTKEDLISSKGVSKSQESLSAMYGLPEPKYHMNQHAWRQANRLTEEGIALTAKRVTDDIVQHKALREQLILEGALGAPKLWSSKRRQF